MRIGNIHQFTEHHRYYIFRDFSLSSMDFKIIQFIYQPMIGAVGASLYQLLYHQVAADRVGYSSLEPQRKLFLGLGLEMNEQGRKSLAEQASKLEAVGLLQTSMLALPQGEDVIYEYELAMPLQPNEFFKNQHLTMYLRDKVGKFAVIALREEFVAREPDELAMAELHKENISVPFYELFRLNTQAIDGELEQALTEVAPARQPEIRTVPESAGIQYGEIILRFPRHSVNRKFVEKLRSDERRMASLNYVAYKYSLNVVDLCRLLDEDGVFSSSGELLEDELQLRANQIYRQERKRDNERQRVIAKTDAFASAKAGSSEEELPEEEHGVSAEDQLEVPAQLAGRCDIAQYNMLMRNEPHTRFLQRFFPGAVPEWLERVFERIDLNYRLPGAVINVLIHYILGAKEAQRVSKTFIDAVAANMLLKQVDTFEKAVRYVREQSKLEEQKERRRESGAAASGSGIRQSRGTAQRGQRKQSLPIVQDMPEGPAVTPEELEELRELARKLDGKA
ncbi:helicase DnaB [Paenibacillus abyssi]|uniref:Replication initiation and membrane attachment protein n=1 Tax=Paenibacillus abyssi TaxID=1340531 RepID=A0A917CT29_9BACL|nr:helicase DnaB [Paenibacillus abyssi]GGF96925.1 replication initiation and membrane attachment protein [Paenibacillus abyssi]